MGYTCPHCGKQIKFKTAGISPVEVLRSKQGLLGMTSGNMDIATTPQGRLFANRKILMDFINEEEAKGNKFIGSFVYEGLPYNGILCFHIPFGTEMKVEESHVYDDVEESVIPQGEKIHEILKRNRENKPVREEHPIPKPKIREQHEDIEDKEALNKMFEDEINKHRAPEKPEGEPEWKTEDDKLILAALESEKKQEKSVMQEVEEFNNEIKKKLVKTIDINDLIAKFELENPGNHAIWKGDETIKFKEWKDKYLEFKSMGL